MIKSADYEFEYIIWILDIHNTFLTRIVISTRCHQEFNFLISVNNDKLYIQILDIYFKKYRIWIA